MPVARERASRLRVSRSLPAPTGKGQLIRVDGTLRIDRRESYSHLGRGDPTARSRSLRTVCPRITTFARSVSLLLCDSHGNFSGDLYANVRPVKKSRLQQPGVHAQGTVPDPVADPSYLCVSSANVVGSCRRAHLWTRIVIVEPLSDQKSFVPGTHHSNASRVYRKTHNTIYLHINNHVNNRTVKNTFLTYLDAFYRFYLEILRKISIASAFSTLVVSSVPAPNLTFFFTLSGQRCVTTRLSAERGERLIWINGSSRSTFLSSPIKFARS